MSTIVELAARQLAAYNASDLEAFVNCYHDDVRVLNGEVESIRGKADFRERYQGLFDAWTFGAAVPQRMHVEDQCFDLEDWWRVDPESGARSEGRVIVRYELKDDRIGTVQFFR